MPIFFRSLRKFFLAGLSELHSRVHRIVFMGSIFFEKNSFPIVFHILGGNFSGFRQIISITVFRTELVSRFLIGFMLFLGLHAKFYRLVSRNCTLCVHRIVFMGSIFFEKKTLFKLYFAFWTETFQVLGKVFQHGSQNFIGF